MKNLDKALQGLQEANLKMNVETSAFYKQDLTYFGHVVGQDTAFGRILTRSRPSMSFRIRSMVMWYRILSKLFVLSERHQAAFPDYSRLFFLQTDASNVGLVPPRWR